MKHYGDITKINGAEAPVVDVITGGSPCQDLSVAGKRAGLAGERSGLFMEQIRIVKEMRERERATGRTGWMVRPRYMVWENVPGAFSSGNPKGADFAAVIEEIIKVAEPGASVSVCVPNGGWTKSGCYYAQDGSWSVAWRLHDAQFWGVPQRRKRISLVADFGGLSAPEILFERKGLSGYTPQGFRAWQGTSGSSERCPSETGRLCLNDQGGSCIGVTEDCSATLRAQDHGHPPVVIGAAGFCTEHSAKARSVGYEDERSPTLRAGTVPAAVAIENYPTDGRAKFCEDNKVQTLTSRMGTGGIAVVQVGCDVYNQEITGDVAASLTAASGGTNTSGPKVFCLQGNGIDRADTAGCNGKGWREDQCYTMNTIDRPAVYDARGNGDGKTVCTITGDHQNRVTDYTALCVGNGQANQSVSDKAGALNTMHDQQAVMVALRLDNCSAAPIGGVEVSPTIRQGAGPNGCANVAIAAVDCRNLNENHKVVGTLQSKENGGYSLNYQNPVRTNTIVRRLTPLECERLQGYPDGWTDIGEWVDSKGKKHGEADSPRYKALGNSIALPFWQWMARRICAQYERTPTMASLFDGIGGFPLVFQRCGAVPVWASEIEEFPIAVTKVRFPDESV